MRWILVASFCLFTFGQDVAMAKDCKATCYAKDKKTIEKTLKWTCPEDKSCSADCTTGKTECVDPVTLKPPSAADSSRWTSLPNPESFNWGALEPDEVSCVGFLD